MKIHFYNPDERKAPPPKYPHLWAVAEEIVAEQEKENFKQEHSEEVIIPREFC